jgi:hypothetical protein
MWDIEAPTFSRQSAHRWQWGHQPHTLATFYPQEDFLVLVFVIVWIWLLLHHYSILIFSTVKSQKTLYSDRLGAGCPGCLFPAGARNFFLLHSIQTGSGAYLFSYSVDAWGSFTKGKVARVWSWPLKSM